MFSLGSRVSISAFSPDISEMGSKRDIHKLPETYMCTCALSCFSHVQLCDSMDCNLPGSSVYGILQERILEWVTLLLMKNLLLTFISHLK